MEGADEVPFYDYCLRLDEGLYFYDYYLRLEGRDRTAFLLQPTKKKSITLPELGGWSASYPTLSSWGP